MLSTFPLSGQKKGVYRLFLMGEGGEKGREPPWVQAHSALYCLLTKASRGQRQCVKKMASVSKTRGKKKKPDRSSGGKKHA